MTIIAEDDKQMADAYVEAVVKALSSKSITQYPAPGRDKECFVIKGSPEFQENIRKAVFPARHDKSGMAIVKNPFIFAGSPPHDCS